MKKKIILTLAILSTLACFGSMWAACWVEGKDGFSYYFQGALFLIPTFIFWMALAWDTMP